MFNDNKERNKLKINILDYNDYNLLKNSKLKNAKIKIIYKFSGYHFYIVDDKNNLLYKVKRKMFNFNDKYIIYNPYDKEKGDLTFREGRPKLGYDVYLYKGNNFAIEKEEDNNNINYTIDSLPIYFKGDILGTNFDIIDKDTKKVIAKVTYYSNGGKGMTYDIEFKDDKYKLEIFLGIICTKLLQINMMN